MRNRMISSISNQIGNSIRDRIHSRIRHRIPIPERNHIRNRDRLGSRINLKSYS